MADLDRLEHLLELIDDLVWNTVANDLSPLRRQIQAALERERRRRAE
jgi:hypothetical protein